MRKPIYRADHSHWFTCDKDDSFSFEDSPVLAWNEVALDAITQDMTTGATGLPMGSDPARTVELMALESIAVFDVISAIRGHAGFLTDLDAPANISEDAAIAGAAYRILSYAFPHQKHMLRAELKESLESVPDGRAEKKGLAFGKAVADAILAERGHVLRPEKSTYVGGDEPGEWRPTPPDDLPGLAPLHGSLTPLVLSSPDQFRPEGPPALTSQEYADAFNEVKLLGERDTAIRTPEQTEIAVFWSNDTEAYTPVGHFNDIAAHIADERDIGVEDSAFLFAELNVALADAIIAGWDAKYAFNFWRPMTAIRLADEDGNPDTAPDPDWSSLLATPNHPEYVSGHSSLAGAAARVLTDFFGAIPFSATSPALPGVTRHFENFNQMADEAALSRIYGGKHYRFSAEDGLELGYDVADAVIEYFNANHKAVSNEWLVA